MNALSIPLSILRLQYKIVRIPFQLFETNVVERRDTEDPARLAYERTIGTLDKVIGGALGASDIERRGKTLVERTDDLARARRLDELADETEAQADQKLASAREAALEERAAAAEAADEAAREARVEAEERKQEAADEAEERAAAEKKRADELAEARAEQARKAEQQQREQIAKVEEIVTAPAEAELADAAEHQEEAEAKKEEAERIEKLFKQ
jgi:hypothetical protein